MKNIVSRLEDPSRPLLGPNYWILLSSGLIFQKNVFLKALYICLIESSSFFVITQYIELYVIRSNLDLVLTNLKISMLSIVCVVKSNTFLFWQNDWKKVIDYVTDADKYEREHLDPSRKKIIDQYTNYCHRVTYFYWVLVFLTFITVTHTPLIHYLSSPTYREELRNGTELFPHIFSSWAPFDKYHSPGTWITLSWHIFVCFYGAVIMGAYDTSVIVIIVFFGGKLQLLRERSKQLLGSGSPVVGDQQFDQAIKHLHNIHVDLTRHLKLFNSLLSPVMFFYVVMCSLMLCASAYQLTSATTTTQKLLMAEYLVFGVMQLFLFTWHSNDVIAKSFDLSIGPYESEWWAANVRQRKSLYLLTGQFRINQVFEAGPFVNLTLSTFIAVNMTLFLRDFQDFRTFSVQVILSPNKA